MTQQEAYRRETILSMAAGFAGSLMANPETDLDSPHLVTYCVNVAAGIFDAVEGLPHAHTSCHS